MAMAEAHLNLFYGVILDLPSLEPYQFHGYLEDMFYKYETDENGNFKYTEPFKPYEIFTQSDENKIYSVGIGIPVPDLPTTDPWNPESISLEEYNEIGNKIKKFVEEMSNEEKQKQILKDINKIIKQLYDEFLKPEYGEEYKEIITELHIIRTTDIRKD